MFAIRFAECNHFSIYFGHIAQWISHTSSRLFPRLARLIATCHDVHRVVLAAGAYSLSATLRLRGQWDWSVRPVLS